jgi:hypothetical protein
MPRAKDGKPGAEAGNGGGKRATRGKFRLFVNTFLDDGTVDEGNCGWISVDPSVEMVKEMSDAKIFTDMEPGHGSAEDWTRFFEDEGSENGWKVSVSWIRENPLRL